MDINLHLNLKIILKTYIYIKEIRSKLNRYNFRLKEVGFLVEICKYDKDSKFSWIFELLQEVY
jgi:hypothetical protein